MHPRNDGKGGLKLAVNARFATRPLSGVDRMAIEILAALGRILADIGEEAPSMSFYLPRGGLTKLTPEATDRLPALLGSQEGKLPGHLWEQIELPFLPSIHWLFSPCNSGPVFRRRQAVTVHDAQIYIAPEAFSRPYLLWYRFLLPRLCRHAQLVMTVSNFSKAELARHGVGTREKIRVLYNGADHIGRTAADATALERFDLTGQRYVLALGNLAPHKNLRLLMEAADERGPGAPLLVVAGSGNPSVFADAGLVPGSSTRLLGRVSDRELKALYEGALALAFPSITEGFGLPPVEAMRCGCPVIASTGGAIPEICGDAALFVDPSDRQGWTSALESVAADTDLRGRLVAAGHTRAAKFTWRRAALQFLVALATVAGNPGLKADAVSLLDNEGQKPCP